MWRCSIITVLITCCLLQADTLSVSGFKNPAGTSSVHAYWHWMDGAVTAEGIAKDLQAMRAEGVTGAVIFNIGLLGGRDMGVPRVTFNSPEWHEMFRFTLREADRLGIEIGMHNSDGWSTSGGPWIGPAQSMKQYRWSRTTVKGGRSISIKLERPEAKMNFYRDVAVVACPSVDADSEAEDMPEIRINDSVDGSVLADGDPFTWLRFSPKDVISITFKKPRRVEKIAMHPHENHSWWGMGLNARLDIEVSEDGEEFRRHGSVEVNALNRTSVIPIEPAYGRYFRILRSDREYQPGRKNLKVSELELLDGDRLPRYFPAIACHLEKTVSLQPGSMGQFALIDAAESNARAIPSRSVIDLTGKMSAEGTLRWDAPEGNWEVIRFGYTTTEKMIGPATAEGKGLEVDKMDAAAVTHHFNSFPKKLVDAAGGFAGNTFGYFLIDSWEAEYQNWTGNFPHEFQERRGYSLVPYIPVLCGAVVDGVDESEAFLHDFRKTIADLIEQNFYRHFSELCHRHGMKLHSEVIYGDAHSPPIDVLKTNSYIDVPMSEFWATRAGDPMNDGSPVEYTPGAKLYSTNPAHACAVYGKKLFAAEAFTGYAHYSETPWDLKLFGDMAFSNGVNRLVLHSYVHQPFDKKPGITLSRWGLAFNRHNTWWRHFGGFSKYLARCQYILQQGRGVSDICCFLGDRMPAPQTGNSLNGLPYGYKADYCNVDILVNRMKVDDGKIVLPGGAGYEVLLLPDDRTMELSTLQAIERLVAKGATVSGPKPLRILSLKDYKSGNRELAKLAGRLWGNADGAAVLENRYGKGKVVWGKSTGEILAEAKLPPDLQINDTRPEDFLFYHKKHRKRDIYYLVNQSERTKQAEFVFRVQGKFPSIWDPVNGGVWRPAAFRHERAGTRVPLCFGPRQAFFVMFNGENAPEYIVEIRRSGKRLFPACRGENKPVNLPECTFDDKGRFKVFSAEGGQFSLVSNKARGYHVSIPEVEEYIIDDIKGTIHFYEDERISRSIEIDELLSFTEYDDPCIKYFSGMAVYEIEFDIPIEWLEQGCGYVISLGEVGASAEAVLNGRPLGVIWQPHLEVRVDDCIKAGKNRLEVITTSVWRNRLIGQIKGLDCPGKTWTTAPVEGYLDAKSPLSPAGLRGPIKIVKTKLSELRLEARGQKFNLSD